MPSALDILKDPNYVNANSATKQAIFNKRVATLPEYRNANAETRAEIRARFNVTEQAPPPPRQKGTGIAPLDFALDAINETALGAVQGAVGLGAFVTDPLVGLIYGDEAKNKMQQQRANAFEAASRQLSTHPMSVYREVGKTVAPGAAVSRTASMAAPALQRAPVVGNALARVAQATATGGIGSGRTAAQAARMTGGQRAADMAARVTGGGIAGAATAGLSDQNMLEGGAFGAALPVVGSLIGRLVGRAVDLRSMPKQRAAQIIRDALGQNEEAARAAFAQLAPDDQRLARQVLVEAGVEPRVLMGLGADVERTIPDEVQGVLGRQAEARTARLAQAAGGSTATERRAGTELARQGVTAATGPAREAALARANVAGEVVPAAEVLADAARRRADEMTTSGFVPRMRGLEERAGEQAAVMADNPAYFPDMERIQQTRGIAGAAGQRADANIATQLRLRDQARDMEDIVADLAAEGMTPLKVTPIVSQLRRMAAAPGTRADKLQRSTLTRLANELEGLADANGVIDARDLYQIRKTGINDIVDRLLGSRAQPSSGTKDRTASLLTSIRPMIDDAIEGAGGQGWKDYLSRTRQGFEAVNRRELAGKGAQLAEENAPEFIKLMRGERPKIVEDIMGPGTKQYDIAGMALSDPRRYLALKQSANELETLNKMDVLSREGASAAAELMNRERPFLARAVTRAGLAAVPTARIGADASEMALAEFMRPRVRQELANAFLSGRNMADVMNMYPDAMRMSETVSQLPPTVRNALAQGAIGPAYAEFPEIDPETGQVLVDIGVYEGQRYPMYGPRPLPSGR